MSKISKSIGFLSKLGRASDKAIFSKIIRLDIDNLKKFSLKFFSREFSSSSLSDETFMDKKINCIIEQIKDKEEPRVLTKGEISLLKRKADSLISFYKDPKKTDYEKNVKTFIVFSAAAKDGKAYELLELVKSQISLDINPKSDSDFGVPRESMKLLMMKNSAIDVLDEPRREEYKGDEYDSGKSEPLPFYVDLVSYITFINSMMVVFATNTNGEDGAASGPDDFHDEVFTIVLMAAGEPL